MIGSLFHIAGSLALFLYGMKVMSDGIQKSAGDRLHSIMNLMTVNRFSAVATGFAVTAIVQSSSATTVMVVGFVNAGLLSLTQAIGVIMGANIGTTVTGWIVAILGFKFSITAIALPAIAVGLPFLFSRRSGRENLGEALIGFGLLFLGLQFLKESVPDIKGHPEYLEFLQRFTDMGFLSYLFFIAAGGVLTVVVQSSSAAMATTLTMAAMGWIDFPTAAAIVLGENIGTTVTANLASIGTGLSARRSARVHFMFNVLGVTWMAFVFRPFLVLVDRIVPGGVTDQVGITSHLAMFHTMFNIVNTLLFVGFVPQLARLIERLVPGHEEIAGRYKLHYIATGLQDTPEINLLTARNEVRRMSNVTEEMLAIFLTVFGQPKGKLGAEVNRLKQMEDLTDQMQEEISGFLARCARENLNAEGADDVTAMMRIIHELERIGDNCFNLILLTQRRHEKKIKLPHKALEEFEPYVDVVKEFLHMNGQHMAGRERTIDIEKAYKMERRVNKLRDSLKNAARKRLAKGGDVKAELLYIDILRHVEQIGDHSLNISQALIRTEESRV